MIELSVIRDLVAIVGVIAGFTYYILTVRNAQKTRELTLKAQEQAIESRNTQFLIQLLGTSIIDLNAVKLIFSDKTWDTFNEWLETNGPVRNPDGFTDWFRIMYGYEIIGALLKRGFLNVEVIDDLMSGPTLILWDKYEPIIKGFREVFGYPQFQEHQEFLVNEITKIVNEQHPDFEGKSRIYLNHCPILFSSLHSYPRLI